MKTNRGNAVLRVIRDVAARLSEDQESDRDLLRRSAELGHEDAFGALVRRHDDTIETESFLMVADADGKNAKVLYSAKNACALSRIFWSIDWR